MIRLLANVSAAVLLLLTACTPASSRDETPAASPVSRVAARAELDGLRVVTRPAADPSYRRASFGPAWADVDYDGCSQRRNALAATVDRTRPLVERRNGRCAHDVIAGTWTDPYTGSLLTFTDLTDTRQAQQIPIDHVESATPTTVGHQSTW